MGVFSRIGDSLREAADRRAAEQQALNERMKPYHRGYDVYPDEVCGYFVKLLRGKTARNLSIKLAFLGLVIAGGVLAYLRGIFALLFILFVPALILIPWSIADIARLCRIAGGNYDAFGAMVTNTHVEEHYSTDSDGNSTTTYTYYVWLNGIKCEVPGGEFGKVGVGTYCYFVRLKAKYIKNDRFYFFPTDPAEADHRTGQHYPADELRLQSAPAPHPLTTLMFVLGIFGTIGGFIALAVTDKGGELASNVWLWVGAGSVGLAAIGGVARGISKSIRNRRIIEEKRQARQLL